MVEGQGLRAMRRRWGLQEERRCSSSIYISRRMDGLRLKGRVEVEVVRVLRRGYVMCGSITWHRRWRFSGSLLRGIRI